LETKKYLPIEAAMSSPRVTHFFKAAVSDVSLLLAAKEAASAHHAANYGQFFKSSDCNF